MRNGAIQKLKSHQIVWNTLSPNQCYFAVRCYQRSLILDSNYIHYVTTATWYLITGCPRLCLRVIVEPFAISWLGLRLTRFEVCHGFVVNCQAIVTPWLRFSMRWLRWLRLLFPRPEERLKQKLRDIRGQASWCTGPNFCAWPRKIASWAASIALGSCLREVQVFNLRMLYYLLVFPRLYDVIYDVKYGFMWAKCSHHIAAPDSLYISLHRTS